MIQETIFKVAPSGLDYALKRKIYLNYLISSTVAGSSRV